MDSSRVRLLIRYVLVLLLAHALIEEQSLSHTQKTHRARLDVHNIFNYLFMLYISQRRGKNNEISKEKPTNLYFNT